MAVDMTVERTVRPAAVGLLVGSAKRPVPQLSLSLLGGFRAERAGGDWPISGWQRRSAKTLTKLLAAYPGHTLHREQLLDILWPGVELESALNSFGKALYAARRALEPELLPRENSSYLRLTDSMVALEIDHVSIDADRFEQLAEAALRDGDVGAYESALAAYGGELLPEDRYEDWCTQRRDYLAELHLRLLLGLAETLESRDSHTAAAARLRQVLHHDPTREDVHRRLMSLYVSAGRRDQAVRQFHVCEDVLKRELDLVPGDATRALYKEILARPVELDAPPSMPAERDDGERRVATPFVGREQQLAQLSEQLTRADAGNGRMILVTGESGVGKSRLVEEFAVEAQRRGCCVLSGGTGAHTNHLTYGPFAVALEGYVASRSDAERQALSQRYPALAQFVPSLGFGKPVPATGDQRTGDQLYLVPAIVRLLTDIARNEPVVLLLGDLHGLHRSSVNLLGYLAPLAAQRRWLIVGTYRQEGLAPRGVLRRMIDATERERLCLTFELERLTPPDCHRLVRALLPGGRVDDEVLEHVYARSLGNPLFVEELVPAMRERGELVLVNGSWRQAPSPSAHVPTSLRALVALRVAPLKESARRVLGLVSAANEMEISLTALRAGAAALQPPVSDVALFDALDRALELHILEERNGSYAFRHPLVRSALYEDLATHRRDELHTALGRSLAASP